MVSSQFCNRPHVYTLPMQQSYLNISMSSKKKKHPKFKSKDGQLIVRINKEERDEFVALCEAMDTTAAREIRRFARQFINEHQH
jgi:hypothetical protein